MWRIVINVLFIIGLAFSWILATKMLSVTHKEQYTDPELYIFNRGNANQEVRQEIMDQLHFFQQGYEGRDTSKLEFYMDRLFSRENLLILGTMPNEIFSGYEEATKLVQSDWLYWGDVRLLVEQSNVSVSQGVAWISAIGNVEFDLSRFLVLPLRFSGVMVKENLTWKFQQVQFQFDLDFSWIMATILLLSVLLIASVVRLAYVIIR